MLIRKSFLLLLLALTAVFNLAACSDTPNYLAPNKPRYAGSYSVGAPDYDGSPKIVTWNIKFSRDIDGAIETFRASPDLLEADAILLQEMDAEGVEAIARALELNYVYYPASVHPKTNRDFGEAILSPWPLTDDAKIILPHASSRNGQIRMAVRARVQTPDIPILVYSVHTETALMAPDKRVDQVQALLDDVPADARPVVIGGDFNTVTPVEREMLLQMMGDGDFEWLTEAAGATVQEGGAGIIMDYIFARGLVASESGVVDSDASDHLPLWVKTTLGQ